MKVLNRKQGIIFSILIILFVMGCFVGIWSEKANQVVATEQEVRTVDFSHDSGWYSETLTVNLYAQGAETILYTLDGSTPHKENETAILYDMNSGIELECTPQEMVYTIKAVAYTKDGSTSVATGTYIIGDKVQQRYKIPVLSVSGNPNDFFSDEDGILVMENGNRFLKGREYEKEVQMTLFDESGSAVLSQNCGFRVYGNFSRNKNQPSFRLYARSEYDEQNDFEYALFKNQYTNENALFSEYKRIIVRNSGDDNGYSYLRSELASRLAIEAGFQDAQCASPVCVYINGEYYGVYWFVTNYDEWYFAEKYGDYEGQMVTLEGVVALVEEQEEEDEVTAQLREEYNALHEFAAYSDLNVEENWEALNERIDVEKFPAICGIAELFL